MGWSPETFWAATPHEFFAARAGWNDAHNPKNGRDDQSFDDFKEELRKGGVKVD